MHRINWFGSSPSIPNHRNSRSLVGYWVVMNDPLFLLRFSALLFVGCFIRCLIVAEILDWDPFRINQECIFRRNGTTGSPTPKLDEVWTLLPKVGLASHVHANDAIRTNVVRRRILSPLWRCNRVDLVVFGLMVSWDELIIVFEMVVVCVWGSSFPPIHSF